MKCFGSRFSQSSEGDKVDFRTIVLGWVYLVDNKIEVQRNQHTSQSYRVADLGFRISLSTDLLLTVRHFANKSKQTLGSISTVQRQGDGCCGYVCKRYVSVHMAVCRGVQMKVRVHAGRRPQSFSTFFLVRVTH